MELSRRMVVVAGVATAAFAWWATGFRPFTWPALAAVGLAGGLAIVLGGRLRDPKEEDVPGVVLWGILVALVAGWELAAYLQTPRADHPTLSSLAGPVLGWRPARAVAFLVWLVVGVDLARR